MALVKCYECNGEVSADAAACPHCGAKPAKPPKESHGIGTILLIGGLVLLLIAAFGKKDEPSKPDPKVQALEAVQIKSFQWRLDGFGTVMVADFHVVNNGKWPIRDFEVTCEAYAKSETRVDRLKRVIYDTIQPSKSRHIRDFNMGFVHGQVARASCYISDLSI